MSEFQVRDPQPNFVEQIEIDSHFVICPVCAGKRIVPVGFYKLNAILKDDGGEPCRSCDGKGYILK